MFSFFGEAKEGARTVWHADYEKCCYASHVCLPTPLGLVAYEACS